MTRKMMTVDKICGWRLGHSVRDTVNKMSTHLTPRLSIPRTGWELSFTHFIDVKLDFILVVVVVTIINEGP